MGRISSKTDQAEYTAVHRWVKKRLEKPKRCEGCRKIKSLELANKSDEYKHDLTDWEWLCRRCHMVGDGRIKALHAYLKKCGSHGISCLKGVVWRGGRARRWCARIGIEGKLKYLGSSKDKNEAAMMYNEAAVKLFGRDTYLNPLPKKRK